MGRRKVKRTKREELMTTTMQWFGHRYDAPAWEDMPEVQISMVGRKCLLCEKVFKPEDDGVTIPNASTGKRMPAHVRCFLKNLGITAMPRRIEARR